MDRGSPARRIVLAALLGTLGSGLALAADVEVSITVEGEQTADTPIEITVLAEPANEAATGASEETLEYAVEPGLWLLDLPADRRWQLQAQAPGHWGEAVEVEGNTAGEVIELRLWRAGSLRGALSTTADEGLPSQIELHMEGDTLTGEAGEPTDVTVSCPVVEEVWECEVPAGQLDLVLTAGRYIPHHRRGVIVEPDGIGDLGSFELELGGSIGGRVELEEGGVPGRECQIRLEALRRGRVDRQSASVAAVEEEGSFEFQRIPAGKYVLTASQPDHLDATSDAIHVLPGKSVRLPQPLVLRRPAALELVFSPPVAPEGRSWSFTIKALDSGDNRPAKALRGESGPDGTWSKEELVPGTYEISVTGNVGMDLLPLKVELPSGWSTLPIELSVFLVEGYVLVGGEPLAAKVTLSRAEEKLSATFQSDETGAFSGSLPREGRWQVQVEAPAERLSMSLDPIEIWAQGGSGVAVVEIRLPDTVLEGEVTDLLGSPLAQATISVRRPGMVEDTRSFETDAQGWFRIRGLEPGAVSVMATADGLQSQWIDVILYEDRPGSSLQIVVR